MLEESNQLKKLLEEMSVLKNKHYQVIDKLLTIFNTIANACGYKRKYIETEYDLDGKPLVDVVYVVKEGCLMKYEYNPRSLSDKSLGIYDITLNRIPTVVRWLLNLISEEVKELEDKKESVCIIEDLYKVIQDRGIYNA